MEHRPPSLKEEEIVEIVAKLEIMHKVEELQEMQKALWVLLILFLGMVILTAIKMGHIHTS